VSSSCVKLHSVPLFLDDINAETLLSEASDLVPSVRVVVLTIPDFSIFDSVARMAFCGRPL
jgi:hypothetical protein